MVWWRARREGLSRTTLLKIAAVAFMADAGWLFAVAPRTIGYITPVLLPAMASVLGLIWHEPGQQAETGRQLFRSSTGTLIENSPRH